MVNPCLILGYNSLNKITGIIFLERQEMPINIELSPFLIIGQHSRSHLAKTFDIAYQSVRIDCTAQKLMPTSQATLLRSRLLSHISRVCTTLTFSSAVASLTLSLPLLNSAAHFSLHCAITTRLLPKGFHVVFMNFLGRHSFLTEVLDNHSDFKFLHFANVSHPSLLKVLYISNQA